MILHLIFPKLFKISEYLKSKYVLGVTILSFTGMIGSLIYSEVIGFPPCVFCWYQRIAHYGIFIISLVALIKRYSREVVDYVMTLSALGLILSIYHVVIQKVGQSPLPCEAGGVSCLKQLVYAFGYISIPVMSLTLFAVVLLMTIIAKRKS